MTNADEKAMCDELDDRLERLKAMEQTIQTLVMLLAEAKKEYKELDKAFLIFRGVISEPIGPTKPEMNPWRRYE